MTILSGFGFGAVPGVSGSVPDVSGLIGGAGGGESVAEGQSTGGGDGATGQSTGSDGGTSFSFSGGLNGGLFQVGDTTAFDLEGNFLPNNPPSWTTGEDGPVNALLPRAAVGFGTGSPIGSVQPTPPEGTPAFPPTLDFPEATLEGASVRSGEVGVPVRDSIVSDIDVDIVRVSLDADETYVIQAVATDGQFDPILSVFDPARSLAGFDDDGGFGLFDALVLFSPARDGVHELAVGGWFSSIGDYALSVETIEDFLGEPTEVALLFEAGLGRQADFVGLDFWTGQLRAGASLEDVANAFLLSDEFTARFGAVGTLDDETFARRLYENVLDRPADDAGLAFWLDELARPEVDRADLLVGFALSEENRAASGDISALLGGGLDDIGFLFV